MSQSEKSGLKYKFIPIFFFLAHGMNYAVAQTASVGCDTSAAVFNTGYDVVKKTALTLTPQQQDLRWQVSNLHSTTPVVYPDASSTWSNPYTYRLINTGGGFEWAASPSLDAQWLTPRTDGSSAGAGLIYYKFKFDFSPSVDYSTFGLVLDHYADDDVSEIFVNGKPQSGYPGAIVSGYWAGGWPNYITAPGKFTLNHDWKSGSNEIIYVLQDAGGGGSEGLLVQAKINSMTCKAAPITATAVPVFNPWWVLSLALLLGSVGFLNFRKNKNN